MADEDELARLRAELAHKYSTRSPPKPKPAIRYRRSPEGEKAYSLALKRKKEDEEFRESIRLKMKGDREAVKERVQAEQLHRFYREQASPLTSEEASSTAHHTSADEHSESEEDAPSDANNSFD